jgi:hypothetical protein
MNVVVLGCGPAGLLAAEAAQQRGHKVSIFSQSAEPSPMGGSQYIHEPIDGVTSPDPDGVINFHKLGTGQEYAEKVYGDKFAPTSWSVFPEGEFPCWNMARAYSMLFDKWKDRIHIAIANSRWLDRLESSNLISGGVVISTIPAKVLCTNPDHKFPFVEVAFESNNQVGDKNLGRNFIFYNGNPADSWYRCSYIFGRGWLEYNINMIPEGERNIIKGIKPVNTDCDCRPKIVRAGRFGEWKKGRLVHHAYSKTADVLEFLDEII